MQTQAIHSEGHSKAKCTMLYVAAAYLYDSELGKFKGSELMYNFIIILHCQISRLQLAYFSVTGQMAI